MRSSREGLLWWLLFAAACGSEATPEPSTPAAPTTLAERACRDGSTLGWDNFGLPFMLTWCTGCHGSDLPEGQRQGAPLGADFDDVEQVRQWADRIWLRAADQNASMPPVGGPHDEERARLGEWLACEIQGKAPEPTANIGKGGSGGAGGGGGAGGAGGAGGGPVCEPQPTDDACGACVKDKCCAEAIACYPAPALGDDNCICWIQCLQEAGTAESCTQKCGEPSAATSALFGCVATSCGASCM